MKISLIVMFAIVLSSTHVFADVKVGNITFKDDGKIIFSDNSAQSTATPQGPQGPQGPQ